VDADKPSLRGWSLLIGPSDAFERFGLRTTYEKQRS
jgi:hypothetical protein